MFSFELKDGTTAEFPHLTDCGMGAMRKTKHIEDNFVKVMTMLEIAYGEDSEEIANFDNVKIDDMPKFLETFSGGLDVKKAKSSSTK